MKTTILSTLNFLKPVLIGGVAIGLVGGTALVAINSTPQEEAPSITDEPTMGEVVEEPSEDNPAIAEGDIPARGEVGAEEVPATKPSTTTKPSTPTQSTPTPTQPTNRKYTTQQEFEKDFLGVCPQDVPEGLWVEKLAAGVSLGYLTSSVNIYDAMSITDYVFSVMKSGLNYYNPNDGFAFAHNLGVNVIGEDGVDQWKLAITIDWSNRKIGWRRIDGGDNSLIGSRLINDMNELTSRMTARLHQREAEFKAKCDW